MKKIAGLILTLDEEINIGGCIDSLDFVDQVFVFDSFSSDETIKIAQSKGAVINQRKFDNYASQRNEAFKSIPDSYEWIVMLDADERITHELREELLKEFSNVENSISMYRLRRKDFFMGKWIKRSSGYPTWFGRVFRNGHVKVEREINEEYHTDGTIVHLNAHLDHYPFSKGLDWWYNKHNLYSTMEAIALSEEKQERISLKLLFSNDPILRRKVQKQLIYRMPFRPTIIFFALYILRLGFLDGSSGYAFCRLRKSYESMIQMKMKELRVIKSGKKF